ncbi:MAG: succinylglutamate desuccinylase, partial [Butyrivibrio sp.]|nr:succinylglutamate desuccinylase [Butyrivibrio sp.]
MDKYVITISRQFGSYVPHIGMRITKEYGDQLVDGILGLMHYMGMWTGETKTPRKPIVSENAEDVCFLNAASGG